MKKVIQDLLGCASCRNNRVVEEKTKHKHSLPFKRHPSIRRLLRRQNSVRCGSVSTISDTPCHQDPDTRSDPGTITTKQYPDSGSHRPISYQNSDPGNDNSNHVVFRKKNTVTSPSAVFQVDSVDVNSETFVLDHLDESEGSSLSRIQVEYVYQQALQSVLNPLGAPDPRPGFRPRDYADRLREVFDIQQSDHDRLVKQVQHTRPSSLMLNVVILEAENLKKIGDGGTHPYCLLSMISHDTPDQSPKNTPQLLRKSSADETIVCQRKTDTIVGNLSPVWNEPFELTAVHIERDILEVVVRHDSENAGTPPRKRSRTNSLKKGLLRYFLHGDSKYDCNCLGILRIQVKNIQAAGTEEWFQLYQDRKQKNKTHSKLKLRLELANKQTIDEHDGVESDLCTIEDFHHITYMLYEASVRDVFKRSKRITNSKPVFHGLSLRDKNILTQITATHRISKFTQNLIEMAVILDMFPKPECPCCITEATLNQKLSDIEHEWTRFQIRTSFERNSTEEEQSNGANGNRSLNTTDFEVSVFQDAALKYIESVFNAYSEFDEDTGDLFPPNEVHIEALQNKFSVISNLLKLPFVSESDLARETASILRKKLQEEARIWIDSKLDPLQPSCTKICMTINKFTVILREIAVVLTPLAAIMEYFRKEFDLDYFKVATLSVEQRVANKTKEVMLYVNAYQVKYRKHNVNIRESSNASLALYFALRAFTNVAKSNLSERELFKLTVAKNQCWFEHAAIFWLQTFRDECLRRTDKALEIDKDKVVQITPLVKCSHSSVDVLSCFAKVTSEWAEIDFQDADIFALGITKITDTICDGARRYCEVIETILKSNGYYDDIDNEMFDVTDKLCITLNNIMHVKLYLHQLPSLLKWDQTCTRLSEKHESDTVGTKAKKVLEDLVSSATTDMLMRQQTLIQDIIYQISKDLNRFVSNMANSTKRYGADPLISYVSTNLEKFREKLEAAIFPIIMEQVWLCLLESFKRSIIVGQTPDYYFRMKNHLLSLRSYFLNDLEKTQTDTDKYTSIISVLNINSVPSEELMMQYYRNILNQQQTPLCFYGFITVKVGLSAECDSVDCYTVHIKVIGAQELPAMNGGQSSSPYVTVIISPSTMCHKQKPLKTKVIKCSTNPTYQETFTIEHVPKDFVTSQGAVVVFSVWNKDNLLSDDFLGEILVPMCEARELNHLQTIDDTLAVIRPLQRPIEPKFGPYTILKQRAQYEKLASCLVRQRRSLTTWDSANKGCLTFKKALDKIRGKESEVQGKSFGPRF